MRHIRGVKGEAVVVYCEPLTTKEMVYHRLSRRVNKIEIKYLKPLFTYNRNIRQGRNYNRYE